MPSEFIDNLQIMYHIPSNNYVNALSNNYIYINKDKISCSLICSICLNPLIDPQTHILCENSFCNNCIKKLKHCPSCQTSIIDINDLKIPNHILRNILDELQVQCNICKKILYRGNFDIHIGNNCLNLNSNEIYIKTHLTNLYNRVYNFENELFELKKIMQAIRQSLSIAIQRRVTFIRPSFSVQQVRYDGSDSRSAENQGKSGKQSDPSKGSNLNKTKQSDKKQKLKSTDDTKQPGTTRKDWSKPNQVVANDPPYGKAGGSTDSRDPDRGKKA